MQNKLFAVYLGGRAPKGNTELHDVVFVTGQSITDTYEQCLDKWFGTPKGLHLDSWMALDVVDGYRVGLSATKVESEKKLYFVNLVPIRTANLPKSTPTNFWLPAMPRRRKSAPSKRF